MTRDQVREDTGWDVKFADEVAETPQPTEFELNALRDLNLRTANAHGANGTPDSNG